MVAFSIHFTCRIKLHMSHLFMVSAVLACLKKKNDTRCKERPGVCLGKIQLHWAGANVKRVLNARSDRSLDDALAADGWKSRIIAVR